MDQTTKDFVETTRTLLGFGDLAAITTNDHLQLSWVVDEDNMIMEINCDVDLSNISDIKWPELYATHTATNMKKAWKLYLNQMDNDDDDE